MRTFAAASLIVLIFRAGFLSGQTGSSTPPAAFVEVDGSRLYYEECGTGQKAVLLLHDGKSAQPGIFIQTGPPIRSPASGGLLGGQAWKTHPGPVFNFCSLSDGT